ncbi:MAG TPA: family 43 glycosylhydrolase [Pirellulales bacterium]|nr:family 43 glycosylhydrolase [Pirellulales bacterium]
MVRRPRRFAIVLAAALGLLWMSARARAEAPRAPLIRNHTLWKDTAGQPIDCHEGGLLRVGDTWYWYGRSYHGNDQGIYGTQGAKFRCPLVCYSSRNLVDWKFERKILTYDNQPAWLTEGTWHRPRAAYNAKTKKYVLWFFRLLTPEHAAPSARDVILVADEPAGPFQIVGEPKQPIEPSGDLAILVEKDGTGFLANGDWRGNGFILKLTDDYLNTVGKEVVGLPASNGKNYEGLSLIRYHDKVLLAGSGRAGLNPTETTYAVADEPLGPYRVKGFMSEKNTWNSQVGSFCYIAETDRLFALNDQWLTGPDGKRIAAEFSSQLWLPVKFDTKTEHAKMEYVETWDPAKR